MKNRSRTADWLLLVAISAFFFLWNISAFGLIGADEPRYAQVAREMLERHDWVTPTLGGSPWLEKPPLYYWQAMVAYKLLGVSDWAARLPSALDAFLLVLAAYFFLRRFRPGMELDGAVITATMAGVVGFSRAASTDMPLAAMFSIAMLAWYAWFESGVTRYLAAFYVFIALAMLAKGPVAPFLAGVLIALFAGSQRSMTRACKSFWLPGVFLFCAVALPWYALVQIRNPQFFHEFIVEHNLARFGTNLYHHPEPSWYYLPVTFLGWVPWSIIVVAVIAGSIRNLRRAGADTLYRFLMIWLAVVIGFFSISKSKLPGYVLPAIPAGALLAADLFRKPAIGEKLSGWKRVIVALVHALLIGGLIFFALTVQYLIFHRRIPWNAAAIPLVAAGVVAGIIFVLLVKSDFKFLRIATLIPVILAVAIALRFGAGPLDRKLSARPVAEELAKFDPQHLPVAVFLVPRETEFGLAFYRNQIIPRYEAGQVPAGEHLVVAAEGYPKGVAKAAGRKVIYLGSFAPQRLEYFYVPAATPVH